MPNVKPCTLLLILDGWGYSDSDYFNAIKAAHSPVWDNLWESRPHTLINTSGLSVGLPEGQMGNSEVGHMTLGAGRVVYQNYTRIDKAIADGDFFTNAAYLQAIDKAVSADKAVHIMGLLSPGGVHSHENHIFAAIKLAAQRGAKQVYLHAFLDGRDTPPRSAMASVQQAEAVLAETGVGALASIVGRYYAMDRDKRWDRVKQAYELIVEGKSDYHAESGESALQAAYDRDENDEFVKPTTIGTPISVDDGDAVIFMNFRPDRARELSQAFTEATFDGFAKARELQLAEFVMTTEYEDGMAALCAYPPASLANTFGDYLSKSNKTQLRIAETEKYAHVTFFFSGGQEALYDGESRILVDSPKVATYDLQPEMSAPELTEKLCASIESGEFDAIICNYANGDMVGHSGVFEAAVKAVEAVDACLEKIVASIENVNGHCLITADHGNVEQMVDPESGQPLTSHTVEPVPLIYIGNKSLTLAKGGSLADIAPTLLGLMDLPQPKEMTGKNLLIAR